MQIIFSRRLAILRCFISGWLLFACSSLYAESFEPRLIESLNALQFQDEQASKNMIDSLLKDYPNSQTAHLIMADILAARAGDVDPNIPKVRPREVDALRQLGGLRDEMRLRWNQNTRPGPAQQGLVPASIIQLSPSHKTVVFVDASNARLYTYKNNNGKLTLAMNNYTTIGEKGTHKRLEGDQRTPIGVYHITRFIDDSDLPPLYGTGAFPINYPNEIDRRYQRTGYGIWLHGTHPESYNRVPLASDGCVAMSNSEFDLLKPLVGVNSKTPVIISDRINWVKPDHLDVTRSFFSGLLEQWVIDWESRDPARYLQHYSKTSFSSKDHNYTSWSKHKTSVNLNKTLIDVDLSDISFFAYPGESDLVVAEYTQQYHSNNFDSTSAKRQYWQLDANSNWKIIYEGPQ